MGEDNIKAPLAELLRAAGRRELPPGWLFLDALPIRASSEGLLVTSEDDDIDEMAAGLGFPVSTLETADLEDIACGVMQLADHPTDDQLARGFQYYFDFDAYLPSLDAPDPPPNDEVLRLIDRQFYEGLGAERPNVPCRREGCPRGAISQSVFCRPHHFESVKGRVSPFPD